MNASELLETKKKIANDYKEKVLFDASLLFEFYYIVC